MSETKDIAKDHGLTTVHDVLAGSLDVGHAVELRERLRRHISGGPVELELDCREVDRIDGAGAQVLLALGQALARSGGSLRLRGVAEPVRTLLTTAGLGGLAANDVSDHAEEPLRDGPLTNGELASCAKQL
jgi:anti-anti-sigma factor